MTRQHGAALLGCDTSSPRHQYSLCVGQLAFFSAELDEPSLDDLGGLLAAHGQSSRVTGGGSGAGGARVSIVLSAPWRASAVVDEMRACGIDTELTESDEGNPLARSVLTPRLDALHATWSRGAVKAVPDGWVPGARALRLWTIAAGSMDAGHYQLGLDPHAPDTHAQLATALMRTGIAPTLVGTRIHSPALRISGRRRLARLCEYVGEAPSYPGANAQWPDVAD